MTKQITLDELPAVLKRDAEKLKHTIKRAILRAAKKSAKTIHDDTPKAFGELRESIHVNETLAAAEIRVSAPHASAVEIGSRPHFVPIDELVKWVKLRGMQGLKNLKNAKKHGSTTPEMSRFVKLQLRAMVKNNSLSVDAPLQIAKAIQAAILKNGTRPHHYVKNSLDVVESDLDAMIKDAIDNSSAGSD